VPVESLPQIAEAPGVKVGVCWQGSRTHERDAERSIPKEVFWQALGNVDNASFFSLQIDDDCAGCATALAPHIRDFRDTANLVRQLDLVISVDTSVAHLSATLGVPTWVLVTCTPDWRWGLAGSASPWYPSVTIFRQPTPGDWGAALEEIQSRLEHQQGSG